MEVEMKKAVLPNIKVAIIGGNLTADAEEKAFEEKSVFKFNIAHNSSYKDRSGEWKTDVSFHIVKAWAGAGKRDYYSRTLLKGAKVLIEGSNAQDRWETEDGSQRSINYINARRISFIEKDAEPEYVEKEEKATDDIPF